MIVDYIYYQKKIVKDLRQKKKIHTVNIVNKLDKKYKIVKKIEEKDSDYDEYIVI